MMKFSRFGDKFNSPSGIGNLMDDLGKAMSSGESMIMLGGGNPGRIPEIENRLQKEWAKVARDRSEFARIAGTYDGPAGDVRFIRALVNLLNNQYNWGVSTANVALTNGSQNAFFLPVQPVRGQAH